MATVTIWKMWAPHDVAPHDEFFPTRAMMVAAMRQHGIARIVPDDRFGGGGVRGDLRENGKVVRTWYARPVSYDNNREGVCMALMTLPTKLSAMG